MRTTVICILFSLSLLVTGCGGKGLQEQELQQAVSFVKKLINSTGNNQLAAISLASNFESGGDITHYIAASTPENAKFRCFINSGPAQPWCVVIKPGDRAGNFIIEGYGDDTTKPLIVEQAVVHAPKHK